MKTIPDRLYAVRRDKAGQDRATSCSPPPETSHPLAPGRPPQGSFGAVRRDHDRRSSRSVPRGHAVSGSRFRVLLSPTRHTKHNQRQRCRELSCPLPKPFRLKVKTYLRVDAAIARRRRCRATSTAKWPPRPTDSPKLGDDEITNRRPEIHVIEQVLKVKRDVRSISASHSCGAPPPGPCGPPGPTGLGPPPAAATAGAAGPCGRAAALLPPRPTVPKANARLMRRLTTNAPGAWLGCVE